MARSMGASGGSERRVVLATRAAALAFAMLVPSTGQARPVSLELVLAIDTSSSVNYAEFNLQMQGYAAAFANPAFIDAVRAAGRGGIAVAVVQWSGSALQELALDWAVIDDEDSADAFARALATLPRFLDGGSTAIGSVIRFAAPMFKGNTFDGARRVIDISGDGRANQGVAPEIVRAEAASAGIDINGLAILNEEPLLASYYQDSVITGPSAFVLTAEDYRDFERAILAKLIREVMELPLASVAPVKPGSSSSPSRTAVTPPSPPGAMAVAAPARNSELTFEPQ